jgi:hypothetical protein
MLGRSFRARAASRLFSPHFSRVEFLHDAEWNDQSHMDKGA